MADKRAFLIASYLGGKRKYSETAELVGLNSAGGLSHWMRRHSVASTTRGRRR